MKQLTEGQLAELLKKAYLQGHNDATKNYDISAEEDHLVDLEVLDESLTEWVDSV